MQMKEKVVAIAATAAAYLLVPDVMTKEQELCFLLVGFLIAMYVIWSAEELYRIARRKISRIGRPRRQPSFYRLSDKPVIKKVDID